MCVCSYLSPSISKNKKINQTSYICPFGKNTRYVEDDTLCELKHSESEKGHPAMINTQQQAVLDQTFTL